MSSYETYTDEQLLQLLIQDDQSAFETIYTRYWLRLYDAAYQRLKNEMQSEDIVQDVFVKLWKRRGHLHIQNLPAYLHTAVRFSVYSYVERDASSKYFYGPFEDIIIADSSKADALVLDKELLHLFHLYVESLPAKRKEIFLMYIKDHLTTGEIANRLGISQKTVQNQLGTAIQGFRKQVAPLILVIALMGNWYA
jgi:RNA polymerase sigma-70 factor (family 1)